MPQLITDSKQASDKKLSNLNSDESSNQSFRALDNTTSFTQPYSTQTHGEPEHDFTRLLCPPSNISKFDSLTSSIIHYNQPLSAQEILNKQYVKSMNYCRHPKILSQLPQTNNMFLELQYSPTNPSKLTNSIPECLITKSTDVLKDQSNQQEQALKKLISQVEFSTLEISIDKQDSKLRSSQSPMQPVLESSRNQQQTELNSSPNQRKLVKGESSCQPQYLKTNLSSRSASQQNIALKSLLTLPQFGLESPQNQQKLSLEIPINQQQMVLRNTAENQSNQLNTESRSPPPSYQQCFSQQQFGQQYGQQQQQYGQPYQQFPPQRGYYNPNPPPEMNPNASVEQRLSMFREEERFRNQTNGNGVSGWNGFDDQLIRSVFIRKVYTILMLQLLFTLGIISLFIFEPNVKTFVKEHIFVYWIALGVFVVVYLALACIESLRRKFPINVIALIIFTLAMSYMMGTLSSFHDTEAVLLAIGITAVVCLLVTLFSFYTKFDFTSCGGLLCILLLVLIIIGIVAIFLPSKTITIVYSSLGAVIFTLFLAFDTQMLMGGKKYELSPEEYIFAAIQLYIDIIYIFMHILTLIGIVND